MSQITMSSTYDPNYYGSTYDQIDMSSTYESNYYE